MKKSSPKVSVLMPSLNVVKYIEQCLSSVINQTLRDIEIICIDAGSTDGTLEIIQSFARKDQRIKIIHSEKKSYGYQMNLGIKASSGQYIGIVETDDYISEDMYCDLYSIAVKNNLDVVKANFVATSLDSESFVEIYSNFKYDEIIPLGNVKELMFTTPAIWSGIYKRNFLIDNKILFLESNGASYQDTGFIIKIWCCTPKICLVKKPYYHYRTDNSNSSVNSSSKVFSVCDEFKEIEKFIQSNPEIKSKMRKNIEIRKIEIYYWNYNRIGGEYKLTFLKGISSEFEELSKENLFSLNDLNDAVKEFYLCVKVIPEAYFHLVNGECHKVTLSQRVKYCSVRYRINMQHVHEKIKIFGLISTVWYYCKSIAIKVYKIFKRGN